MIQKRWTIEEAMVHASEMSAKSGKPESYYWNAVWWRLFAKESKNPSEMICSSRAQLALYRDMKVRPEHYASPLRPDGQSDWQWSGLSRPRRM